MPREDLEEEKKYEKKNNKEVEIKIITENELLNMKLDRILENQIQIINLMSNYNENLNSDLKAQKD